MMARKPRLKVVMRRVWCPNKKGLPSNESAAAAKSYCHQGQCSNLLCECSYL